LTEDLEATEKAHNAYREAQNRLSDLETTQSGIDAELRKLEDDSVAKRQEIDECKYYVARASYPTLLKEVQKAENAVRDAWMAYKQWHKPGGGRLDERLGDVFRSPSEEQYHKSLDKLYDR